MTYILELTNVTKLYGTVIGVNDITVTLPAGAYGLLGPNGAGKSTLLNILTGQLTPTIGDVKVLGYSPRNEPKLMAQLGYLPGNEGMYADVSALEWVTYLTQLHGYSHSAAKEKSVLALRRVDLEEHMHRQISTYSRGMRQRTRLAQAIAHEPSLLILDEPFSGLDPIARHSMNDLLLSWVDEGRSLIVASHVLHEIESLTRSFLLLSGGRLLASGSADHIQELLFDVPSEITIQVDNARQLAAKLMTNGVADAITLTADDTLIVVTRQAIQLSTFLAESAIEKRFVVREIRSADDSLQDVFNQLMKIHRGEQ